MADKTHLRILPVNGVADLVRDVAFLVDQDQGVERCLRSDDWSDCRPDFGGKSKWRCGDSLCAVPHRQVAIFRVLISHPVAGLVEVGGCDEMSVEFVEVDAEWIEFKMRYCLSSTEYDG